MIELLFIVVLSAIFIVFVYWIVTTLDTNKCPLNGDKPHGFKPVSIRKHMDVCDDYIVEFRCIHCEETDNRHFVKWSDCLRMGCPIEELRKVSSIHSYYFKDKSK